MIAERYNEKFAILSFEDCSNTDWNNFVYNNSTGYAYHIYEAINNVFINIENCYSKVKNISFSIIDKNDKNIVLLMPLYLKFYNNNLDEVKYELVAERGIVFKDNLPPKYSKKLSYYFICYIEKIVLNYKISRLHTEMPALCEYNNPIHPCVINPLIFYGFKPNIRYTWIVDLRKKESLILAHCEQTTRQAIRKYIFNNDFIFVEATQTTSEYDCIIFKKLIKETYCRNYINTNESRYYDSIFNMLSSQLFRAFFIKSKLNNEIIATAIILIYKDTAKYFLSGSINTKPVGINKFLIYKIMIELKKSGISFFEVGGAYPYLNQISKRKGISDFKKSFGTFLHIIYTGDFYLDTNNSDVWIRKIKNAKKELREKGTITL